VSSKSSAWHCAPLASEASKALVRRPRPTTVACGSPPVAAITDASASASGSIDPRIAVPSQSVIERFAASITAGGTAASSRPSTKSTSASITGVLPAVIAISSSTWVTPPFTSPRQKGSMYADRAAMTTLPLTGYRVLELAHLIAGPACGMYLADMGADVVKIEQPTGGDASRTAYGTQLGGESAVFLTVNRNKRSVALDLARPEGRAAFDRLAARADVVIEAYRGGVAERLGIDWPRLARLNPRLVYCSLSAFGPDGPWHDKPGVDMLVQAMGGLMAVMGEPDGPPVLCGAPVLDTIGAVMAGQGILTALLHRERTGEGQRVDVSLLAGTIFAHDREALDLSGDRRGAGPLGQRPSLHRALFRPRGSRRMGVRRGLARPPVGAVLRRDRRIRAGPRPALRDARRPAAAPRELTAQLAPIFRTRTVADWMARLEAHDVLCGAGQSLCRIRARSADRREPTHRRTRASARGTLSHAGPTPIRFDRTPGGIGHRRPRSASTTDAV
jgi:crotonobetainyl-CoA:carnitine CoA-transferase CaiB-like acyl-CoA transferase